MQAWVIFIKRRAIGAHGFVVRAQINEDVWMVEGLVGALAHELLGANANDLHAEIIVEMGDRVVSHHQSPQLPSADHSGAACDAIGATMSSRKGKPCDVEFRQ